LPAPPAYFQANYSNLKLILPRDFGLELFEARARVLSDRSAFEADEVQVIKIGSGFIIVLFTFEVHQIQFVNQTQCLEQFQRAIDSGAVDLGIFPSSQHQERRGVKVPFGVFDGFDQRSSLLRYSEALRRQFLYQCPINHPTPSCRDVLSDRHLRTRAGGRRFASRLFWGGPCGFEA
jgi:hypothetical protein